MIFLIIFTMLILIFIVLFVSWFVIMKVNGNCPLCALKKLSHFGKMTMDISNEEDFGGAAMKPPMGWSSWNTFRQNIDETLILDVAGAMQASGLAEAGYQYMNLDDCWQSSMRDDLGRLQGDLQNFSRGIPALIEDINSMGLKVGLYSSNGTLTCEDLPASMGNELLDAKTIASWGCEFFKYDFCHHKTIRGDVPIIEGLEITRVGESSGISLRSSDAKFTGRAREIACPALPSEKGIAMLGFGAGTASFDVPTIHSGKYVLTILYNKTFCRHERYLRIKVNGMKDYDVFFPVTFGASPTARTQIYIELEAGENILKLYNPVVTRADSSYLQYSDMGKALKEATKEWAEYTDTPEKPIVFSICEWGFATPYKWGAKAGNLWRTTPDIFAKWSSIKIIYKHTIKLYKYACPGAWNDPDMLEVGNGKLTEDENKAHFTIWCMMAAPLILGNDIRKFVDGMGNPVKENGTLKIVTNKNLINIDQDSLGKPAKRIKCTLSVDLLARPLQNGDIAFCIFNKSSSKKTVSFNINSLADEPYLSFSKTHGDYEVHELWSDERFKDSEIKATLPKHSVKIYRIRAF